MKLYIKKIEGLKIPTQATENDAGYDIVATTDPVIWGDRIVRPIDNVDAWKHIRYIEYGTNLYVAPETEEESYIVDISRDRENHVQDVSAINKLVFYHTEIFSRSSISAKNLVLANSVGTIDNGYRNQIMCRFKYLFQPEDLVMLPEAGINRFYGMVNQEYIYHKGDRIAQIKGRQNIPIEFIQVDSLPDSERGLGGFGSSGR